MIARFLHGIVCGLFSATATIYLAEIAPRSLRGAAITLHQSALQLGILISNASGSSGVLGTPQLWPYLYGVGVIPALVSLCFLPFCSESPKFVFLKKNDSAGAEQS
jgi:MFS family permease